MVPRKPNAAIIPGAMSIDPDPTISDECPDAVEQDGVLGDAQDEPCQDSSIEISTRSIVEAVLFATDTPLPVSKLAQIVGTGDAREMRKYIAALNEQYEVARASFRVEEVAGGFQMLTLPAYHKWVGKLMTVRRETKLTGAALETLAVIAYKQPALRADIEAVRGVAVGDMVNRLREMGLVKIVGRAEIVGRPMLYGTTKKFLEVFGLASLKDLPTVESLPKPPEPKLEFQDDADESDDPAES